MPRTKRLAPVNSALHIMCRGNNRQNIFNREEDKDYYYRCLCNLKDGNKIRIFNYCFMDNHLHLLVWLDSKSNISRFMKQSNLCYFNYFRKAYGYCGHLWQGRFKSNIIDTDSYLLQCGKYIELNPVRAGIVKVPEDYRYSSFNHYTKGQCDSLITDSPAYIGLSDNAQERMKHYMEFAVDENIINAKRLAKQRFIGSEYFVRNLQDYYAINNENLERGRPKRQEK